MTLWNSSMFALACLPHSYRFSEFRDCNAVGDGVAVVGVVNQNTRQKHGAQVVPVQNIHGQSRGSCSSVGREWSAVLENKTNAFNFNLQTPRRFVALCTGSTRCLS